MLRPDRCRVQIEIANAQASPKFEGEIANVLFAAEGSGGDICGAITAYARASGMTTRFYLGRESWIVSLSDSTRELPLRSA